MDFDITQYRLVSQHIASPRCREPVELVAALGAVQAQDYLGALWAIGLRLPEATEDVVERAITERKIIRTWPLRGTLHFVSATDVRWMLELLSPRTIAGSTRSCRELELDAAVFTRSRKLFIRALRGNRRLTRGAMMDLLQCNGVSTARQRGYHILWRLAQEGLVCFAARAGKQQTLTLLEEWAPPARSLSRDAALAELARRYFTGHGPATLPDFAWWTGLKISDANAGLDSIRSQLSCHKVDGTAYWMSQHPPVLPRPSSAAYLLPGFDEYLLGYRDRSAVLEPQHAQATLVGGRFLATMVIDGRVVGTWTRALKKERVEISACAFKPLKKAERSAFAAAAAHYGRFLGRSAKMRIETDFGNHEKIRV
jgi:hypothetical protein